MTYGVVSDIHAHAWNTFSKTNPDGVNSRLRMILDELVRAARTVKTAGGSTLVVAGDIFHSRGTIDPEVLNPVRQTFENILGMGLDVEIIPGNHDLKSRGTTELGSSVQNLAQISITGGQLRVHNQPVIVTVNDHNLGFVPWCYSHEELHEGLETLRTMAAKSNVTDQVDVFIHAGIDGVLSGMPASGLTPADLSKYGFRRVFAGHYHNHADMGDGVYSIGATTHHSWRDVNARAGFLTVNDVGGVTFNDTMAPKFEDITGFDEMEMELACKGNYVRFSGPAMTQQDIDLLRQQLNAWGALGVSIQVPKAISQAATASPVKGKNLDTVVEEFVDANASIPASVDKAAVKARAAEVLRSVREVVEEV